MQTVGSVVSSYFARYKFSSYRVGNRVAWNILFPWEFLRPLLKGGTVYVIPDDVVFVPRALARFISEHRISEILFTPSLLQGVLNSSDLGVLWEQLSSLRVVWLNGEVAPDVLPESAHVFNTYSISETHDVCTIELTDLCLDGMATIVGRTDSMVKIRGYSVYVGAIEETLRKHCDVSDAAVVAESLDETSKRLVAYVIRGPRASWRVDSRSGTSRGTCAPCWNDICRSTRCPAISWNWTRFRSINKRASWNARPCPRCATKVRL